MQISSQRNPKFNAQINPQFNAQINPQFNAHINPQFNAQINPQFNAQINPQFNAQINPQFNAQINPQFNPQINPQFNAQINPQFNAQLNPKTNSNFGGLYFFDLNNAVKRFAVYAPEDTLVIFDPKGAVTSFAAPFPGGYAIFAWKDLKQLGYLLSDGETGFNEFAPNGDWIGHVK